jgi:hypothetical protein
MAAKTTAMIDADARAVLADAAAAIQKQIAALGPAHRKRYRRLRERALMSLARARLQEAFQRARHLASLDIDREADAAFNDLLRLTATIAPEARVLMFSAIARSLLLQALFSARSTRACGGWRA